MAGALGFPTREESVLADILESRAAATPDKPAILFTDGRWTSREAAAEAWIAGNALQASGVRFGDCVSVWLPPGRDALRFLLGSGSIGAIYAPLNPSSKGTHLQQILNLAESRVIVAHPELVPRLAELDLPSLEIVIVTGSVSDLKLPYNTVCLDDFLRGASDARPTAERAVEPWDDFSLIYTSGTTGPSKAVRAAYAAFWNYCDTWLRPFHDQNDVYLQSLPMFHTAGTGITYSMLSIGATVAITDGFNAKRFWEEVSSYGATATLLIHGMVSYLLDQPATDHDDENTLRVAYMGPLHRSKEFARRFGLSLYTGFGMTEVPVPIVSTLDPDNEQSCGRAADPVNYELRVVDEFDLPVADGIPGELVVRHTLPWTINSGYKNMSDATAQAWRNGWFHTGDQFVRDNDGNYYFIDRIKDAIRRRGENISSFEVESEIRHHPLVTDVAVVGVPNPDLQRGVGDEEVKAVVVVQSTGFDPAAFVDFLEARMPRHWVPRFVEIVDALPRTESHKVKKAELRQRGVTDACWDRERAGIRYKREQLT